MFLEVGKVVMLFWSKIKEWLRILQTNNSKYLRPDSILQWGMGRGMISLYCKISNSLIDTIDNGLDYI